MQETSATPVSSATRSRSVRSAARAVRWSLYVGYLVLLLLTMAYLGSFAAHAWLMLHYPYPLDYGEGPLLAQVEILRSGTAVWQLYADPDSPPYAVVNYPPLYPLLALWLSRLTGDVLLAGRLLSLLATLGSAIALALLSHVGLPRHSRTGSLDGIVRLLPAFLFLSIPIVQEWSVLMRVDMTGVCLGLWGLLALHRAGVTAPGRRWRTGGWAVVAGGLFLLTLFTKPSLIAAPAAGCAWLLFRWYRQPSAGYGTLALIVVSVTAAGGALLFGLLHWLSEGWFTLHVVKANANRWDADLARQFWIEQTRLRWPLALAAVLGVALGAARRRLSDLLLPVLYLLGGTVTAIGVGKVGAYANYFLELYAGLIWISGMGINHERRMLHVPSAVNRYGLYTAAHWALILLLGASLLYYPPTWNSTTLYRAGLLEPVPPRMAFGTYPLWHDLQREAEVLAAHARVQADLTDEVRAAGPLLFTDIPGIAAQAGVLSRLQVFEHRQLFDQNLWDQQSLLLELANGALPLAVIDFLGNWLTPEMIELLQRRYAQDSSRGTFDLYRPVAPGPRYAADLAFGPGPQLTGYHLAPPAGSAVAAPYESGTLLVVTLEWQRDAQSIAAASRHDAGQTVPVVVLQLLNSTGEIVQENERPLVYGVLPWPDWPAGTDVQHMQPLPLPVTLEPGSYELAVTLRGTGQEPVAPRPFARIAVEPARGRWFDQTGYFVSAVFLDAWTDLGGLNRVGYPLTPAVPFTRGTLQCFERACLEARGDTVVQRPLGHQLYLAETNRSTTCVAETLLTDVQTDAPARVDPLAWLDPDFAVAGAPTANVADRHEPGICPGFAEAWQRHGGEDTIGPAISGTLFRNAHIVQWTRFARLERVPGSTEVRFGRLGDESLRLAPGVRYRWP